MLLGKRTWAVTAAATACWLLCAASGSAEWYVAGQGGVNFADRLKNVQGTGPSSGLLFADFDLVNSAAYGGKIGVFPGNGAIGIELDVFHSTPHIKALDNAPGIHLAVTNVGLNMLFRYPGPTFQPYAGIGGAALIAHLGQAPGTQSDSDVGFGLNLIAGMRAFVTPYVAIFTEYKYTQSLLIFDQALGSLGGFSGDYRAQIVMFGVSYHF